MIERPFWIQRLEEAWRAAPVVWLAGVRRIGKTTLVKSLGEDSINPRQWLGKYTEPTG